LKAGQGNHSEYEIDLTVLRKVSKDNFHSLLSFNLVLSFCLSYHCFIRESDNLVVILNIKQAITKLVVLIVICEEHLLHLPAYVYALFADICY
jgi:hypothetical protein